MRHAFAAVVCALLAGPAAADDKPKPNTLTPKEAADGWLLLFDGETTFGWKIDGDAKVKDGVLLLGGGKATTATFTTRLGSYDLLVEADAGGGSFEVISAMGSSSVGLPNQPVRMDMKVRVEPGSSGVSQSVEVGPDKVARMGLELTTDGPAVFRFTVPERTTLPIKSVKAKPVGTRPLFNGKDLTGWKVFQGDPKRTASRFEVTPAGELKVTNGPGDLQTDKAFDNFVLQFECKTNGKGLNSGIFFRCIPDQYQNGYEAQVQNAFKGDDRTQPADFGTGAIYRRVPARKVVSNDLEWFTMTVVADGNHFATWVNGYQTVEWTDDRPANDNPRQGFRAAKGHLSIQGHDPTTDLLFRNIRIAELPAGKK